MIVPFIKLLLAASVVASIGYYLVCIVAAVRFFSDPSNSLKAHDPHPPASILIPLCGADFEAYENYAGLCRMDYPDYEIVFGVQDPGDSSVAVVRKLMNDFPDSHINLVVGRDSVGANPKVNNLHNMLATVKHEHLVIVDSDIRVDSDFLRTVMPPLGDEKVGLVTCFYKAFEVSNAASLMEAVGITGEFAPGVLVSCLMEGMTFSLGAVMATSKTRLRAIGGLEAIADYLADDFMLGNLLWKAGYEIKLLPYVVDTLHPHADFKSMLKHQIRWGRGINACRPAGYFGSVITHGCALALINAVVAGGTPLSLLMLAVTAAAQLIMGWIVGVRCLGDDNLRQNMWLLVVRDLLSFFIWCLAVTGRNVEWRGKTFRLVEDGKIVPVHGRAAPS